MASASERSSPARETRWGSGGRYPHAAKQWFGLGVDVRQNQWLRYMGARAAQPVGYVGECDQVAFHGSSASSASRPCGRQDQNPALTALDVPLGPNRRKLGLGRRKWHLKAPKMVHRGVV